MSRTWIEVSRVRLAHNLEAVRRRLSPEAAVLAVVKADAYGHGVHLAAPWLAELGVREFVVATPEEGVRLRSLLPSARILVLGGYQSTEELELCRRDRLVLSVFDQRPVPQDLPVEIKVDTGLTRLGIPWTGVREFVGSFPGRIEGIFSHLSSSDEDLEFTELQVRRFREATEGLPFRRHICNSAALHLPQAHLDAVRPGLALYGIAPSPGFEDLLPVLTWKTTILSVRDVSPGTTVGYGRTYSSPRAGRIGILPVGYADGYSRALSECGEVLIRDRRVPVVGRVSMDLTAVDLTDLPEAQPGDGVVLVDSQDLSSPLTVTALSRRIGTIPYEFLTRIGPRVARAALKD